MKKSKAMRKIKQLLGLSSVLTLVVTGCSWTGDPEPVSINKAKYGMYFSPPGLVLRDGDVFTPNYGYVVLINQDGGYQLIKTDGMDNGRMAWGAPNQLSFADQSYNYLVGQEGVTKYEAEKTDLQNYMTVAGANSYVSSFNHGGPRGKYENQITLVGNEGLEYLVLPESLEFMAACPDGSVIGGGLNLGSQWNSDESSVGVFEIFNGHAIGLEHLWSYKKPLKTAEGRLSLSYSGLVCSEEKIYLLIRQRGSQSQDNDKLISKVNMAVYDRDSGESVIKPLWSNEVEAYDGYGPSLREASLYKSQYLDWYSGNSMYRTDVETGETRVLIELEEDSPWGRRVTIDEKHIYELVELEGEARQFAIKRHSRVDGKLVDRLETKPIKELDNLHAQYDFSVRPEN